MDFKRGRISKLSTTPRQFSSDFRTDDLFWLAGIVTEFAWIGVIVNPQLKRGIETDFMWIGVIVNAQLKRGIATEFAWSGMIANAQLKQGIHLCSIPRFLEHGNGKPFVSVINRCKLARMDWMFGFPNSLKSDWNGGIAL
ncbi:hypothetical protein AVEN_162858-1 [Araneus ventricosus]|uniref:Uncharacterized protein n=1 Tax=Araneus ventricosus TaxID=182803 RepID=A0A4Y2C877_ARAVE|nr:hypothetical protein AVEN_162858-1 [Araneus ventricosus]